jgi:hypothetical protein
MEPADMVERVNTGEKFTMEQDRGGARAAVEKVN